jgi:2-oxoglutarate dehydrogenase E2 component (dihydrolipoamide succinyltransferase)
MRTPCDCSAERYAPIRPRFDGAAASYPTTITVRLGAVELVTMPQLGETVTEGTITRWFKQPGDSVAVDDVLFEVSTDKVDTEVPSAHAGYLRVVRVAEGETVPVGTPLAVITDTADEEVDEEALPSPAGAPPSEPDRRPAVATGRQAEPRRAKRPAGDGGDSPGDGAATGNGYLSPVVRSLLAEHGLDPSDVVGTGAGGRISRNDVLATVANRARLGSGSDRAAAAGPAAAPVSQPGPDDEVVPFTKSRRATADHMVRSRATSAHTLVVTEVDYQQVDVARRSAGLSYLPFVARATIEALRAYPHLNASVGDDQLIVHRRIHLGVAVDVAQEALVVPVIRDAGDLRLLPLADAMAAAADRARHKHLGPADLSGGTFTITNVGSYGTLVTAPIINQPQVAILSTDSVRMRPAAVRTGAEGAEWAVAVRPLGNLSLTFDHRAFDGAYASAFLAMVREQLETRDWEQEL